MIPRTTCQKTNGRMNDPQVKVKDSIDRCLIYTVLEADVRKEDEIIASPLTPASSQLNLPSNIFGVLLLSETHALYKQPRSTCTPVVWKLWKIFTVSGSSQYCTVPHTVEWLALFFRLQLTFLTFNPVHTVQTFMIRRQHWSLKCE